MTIRADRIKHLFASLDLGKVYAVEFTNKYDRNGKNYKTAVIYFESWFDTESARVLQTRIRESTFERPCRMVYSDPLFWILLEYGVKNVKTKTMPLVRQTCHQPTYAVAPPQRQTCRDVRSSEPVVVHPISVVEEDREFLAWSKAEQEADNERFGNSSYQCLPDYTDQHAESASQEVRVEENPEFDAWAKARQEADNERFGKPWLREASAEPLERQICCDTRDDVEGVIEIIKNHHAAEIFALKQEIASLRDMLVREVSAVYQEEL